MTLKRGKRSLHPAVWTLILIAVIVAILIGTIMRFNGSLNSYVPVTLESDRSGLVMESGAKVKMRGVQVGRVEGIIGGREPVKLKLALFPDQIRYIPANVQAQIRATTAFGAKYVDLIPPAEPAAKRISAGATVISRNVSTEVNTVFQNIVDVLRQVDPPKLNAVLGALADGVRGQGERIGEATSDANQVLEAINPRMETVAADWRSFKRFSDAYGKAAKDIITVLDTSSTVSSTVTGQSRDLDALLLNTIGFSQSGINLVGPNRDAIVNGINKLQPTTDLLLKYNPIYTCTLQGAQWFVDHGGKDAEGGNGYSVILDAGLLLADDPYRYPDNLPIVAAKGGPGGKPSCGSLPDASKNYPIRALVTNTGWGTGQDIRVNPGIGFPGWVNYFPVTRAKPEPPVIRNLGGPAPGPPPAYPGGPPFGVPQYAPDGTPLYAPPPGAPPPPPIGPLPWLPQAADNPAAVAPPDTPPTDGAPPPSP
ncbi:MCE family protein [Mycobacterium palustre]|uniref:MCE-family protein MCE3A n=1 Tax=Mycobacterium palustre TaxID=153971 RepID=A0A1X1ZVJ4_9MYCO|nr:MCE family protein [Mycobacterium palustre]ORW28141.1 MCE-family protein MCE3A [Mycobacterium palustre]